MKDGFLKVPLAVLMRHACGVRACVCVCVVCVCLHCALRVCLCLYHKLHASE